MRVRLIKRQPVEDFAVNNALSRASLADWLHKLKYADWNIPEDIYCTFPTADLMGNGSSRVVFNAGGNKYRIIGKYWFGISAVHLYIKWIGTHAEYSRLCLQGKQFTIDQY